MDSKIKQNILENEQKMIELKNQITPLIQNYKTIFEEYVKSLTPLKQYSSAVISNFVTDLQALQGVYQKIEKEHEKIKEYITESEKLIKQVSLIKGDVKSIEKLLPSLETKLNQTYEVKNVNIVEFSERIEKLKNNKQEVKQDNLNQGVNLILTGLETLMNTNVEIAKINDVEITEKAIKPVNESLDGLYQKVKSKISKKNYSTRGLTTIVGEENINTIMEMLKNDKNVDASDKRKIHLIKSEQNDE